MRDIGNRQKVFNLQEAQALLPLLVKITERHISELEPIQYRLNRMLSNDPRRPSVEAQFEVVVARWKVKVEQLGASASGLWLIDFDVGDGLLSWRYPELSIAYVRGYDSAFSSRRRLTEYIEEQDPDWAC